MEQQQLARKREEQVQTALEIATPVPQSFEQAVSWACTAAIDAAEAGRSRQSMYFYAGSGDSEVSGEIGDVLPFAELFVKTLAEAAQLEGGCVRVLLTDMGAAAMCLRRWEPLPPQLKVDYFPPVIRGQEQARGEERNKLQSLLDSEFLVIVGPTQAELPAVLQLIEVMRELGKDVPMIFINARLVQNAYVAAGTMLKSARELERSLLPTFHLEQYDPSDQDDFENSAVITRVWPRPFSLWEDNPEDPEAVDGFFLLDLRETQAQSGDTVRQLMASSKDLAAKMAEKAKKALQNKRRRS